MCISTPKVGATSTPAPQQTAATDLELGTAGIVQRSAGLYGRLALTAGRQSARSAVKKASTPTPAGATTASTPGGTLGLPSNYAGSPVYGGIISSDE